MKKQKEIRILWGILILFFCVFLLVPMVRLLLKSAEAGGGISVSNYQSVLTQSGFFTAFLNSVTVSAISSLAAVVLAFFLAYTIHYTNLNKGYKTLIRVLAVFPMLLPTITYGFAIIYSFGKQGLLTKLFGRQMFEMYGFGGLFFGYVIYTLPISFLLILNTMEYVDKKFMIVSRVMQDGGVRTFFMTVLRPLMGTLAASFVQCFFLCFTDYGIPASVGGTYEVVATVLYNEMLGSIPDFGRGAVVAVVMMLPSVLSILILKFLERYNIRYGKISVVEIPEKKGRDIFCGAGSAVVLLAMLSVFAVIFVVPLVEEWPYRTSFTLTHVKEVFADSNLFRVCLNSLWVAGLTAILGLLSAYAGALITTRSQMKEKYKAVIESIASVTNTIPGMVIGIAFLLMFSGTSLQNTFTILIICNVVHFFSTPYRMMKGALEKLNSSWETTAKLMGDTWLRTLIRVVTPNMKMTMLEVFGYYFVNAMVTVSAVIFLAGTRTMVITTKIKELQYYTKFNEIFVLSLWILTVNLAVKGILGWIKGKKKKGN